MIRNSIVFISLVAAGCASASYPLLEQDGQYKAPSEAAAPLPPALTQQRVQAPQVPTQELDLSELERALDDAVLEAPLAPAPAVVRRTPEYVASAEPASPFPELEPARQIEPVVVSVPQPTEGPYFQTEAPASLPPLVKAQTPIQPTVRQPQPVTGPESAPRVVGQAAPSAAIPVAAPVRRSRPLPAVGAPQALGEPFAAPPPVVLPVTASDGVDAGTAQTLQRTIAQRAAIRVNTIRAARGLDPLAYSEELSRVAQAHVVELAARGAVTALSADGKNIGARLRDSAYPVSVAASLVAGGYPTLDAALESWLANEVEASRLLQPNVTEFGFAVVTDPGSTYRTYIEAIFAAP